MSAAMAVGRLRFSTRELRDLALAWVAIGVAFAIFFAGGANGITRLARSGVLVPLAVSLVTVGFAFLFHELAHKVVAVRFGQLAEFRADYGMLFLAVMSAMLGFIFAAPGAVHHRGHITEKQNGLIALAGPVTNLVFALVFAPVAVAGVTLGSNLLALLGARGLAINLFLAAFNLIPYGGLDGRTVMSWSSAVWAGVFVPSAVIAFVVVFVLGIGF